MAATLSLRHLSATACQESARESDTGSAGEMLEIGDIRIDTRGHKVTLRGEPFELTVEEFDVLVFLTTNPQRVVTPQTTLATHWPGAGTQQTQFLRVLGARSLQTLRQDSNTCEPNPSSSTVLTRSVHRQNKAWIVRPPLVKLPVRLYELFMHSLDNFYAV